MQVKQIRRDGMDFPKKEFVTRTYAGKFTNLRRQRHSMHITTAHITEEAAAMITITKSTTNNYNRSL